MRKHLIDIKVYTLIILLIFNSFQLLGCYSIRETTKESNSAKLVYKIETNEGKIIDFKNSKPGFAVISGDKIVNTKKNGEEEIYLLSEVKKVYTKEFSAGKTVGLVMGSAAIVCVILIAAFFIAMDGSSFGG